ncbi:serine hydrolase domain-containing protein [Kordia sp.]|uniref:serine hydrolase domain-containing protein n=1 Tax=Kordia sp. TaxID=1965332 RepID=UPI003B5C796D
MRAILFLSLFLFCVGCKNVTKPTKASTTVINDSLRIKSDEYLTKLTELKQFNGVVFLLKDGKEVLRKAYNISEDVTSSLFVTEKSQFDLRSISKLFAKISVLQLEEKGILKRSDFIKKYLPNFPNGDKITIQHLIENRSGLPRELSVSNKKLIDVSPEEVIELAVRETLEFTPGTEERYSNVGFQLIYYIIGKIHKNSYADYLQDTFFTPLHMKGSGSNFYENVGQKTQYAHGHYLNDDTTIVCECSIPDDDMQMGNLYATVDDLVAFSKQFDSKKHKAILHDGSISHAGGTRGKRAYIERNLDKRYTIIFLANYDEVPFQNLVTDLQKILEGKPVNMPKAINRTAISLPRELLLKYEGTYDFVDAGHLILTLKVENDSLFIYQKGKNNGAIYPENETTFFGDKTSQESIQFVKENSGKYHILMDFKGVQWKGINIDKK